MQDPRRTRPLAAYTLTAYTSSEEPWLHPLRNIS